jgi:hypothetical protein
VCAWTLGLWDCMSLRARWPEQGVDLHVSLQTTGSHETIEDASVPAWIISAGDAIECSWVGEPAIRWTPL